MKGELKTMKTRYYVVGMGYDENDHVTDYEQYFGDFDTLDEARSLLIELMRINRVTFFENIPCIYQLCICIEECEEDEEGAICVDVHDEWWLVNPNWEESES